MNPDLDITDLCSIKIDEKEFIQTEPRIDLEFNFCDFYKWGLGDGFWGELRDE